MSTLRLPYPAALRDQLQDTLPRDHAGQKPGVIITPRGTDHRRCAAYDAAYYEVQVFYVVNALPLLGPLEAALRALPGVFMTTQVRWVDPQAPGEPMTNTFTNPDWPAKLSAARRDRNRLRVQVIALIEDPARDDAQLPPVPGSAQDKAAGAAVRWLREQQPGALMIAREIMRRRAANPSGMYESGTVYGLTLALSYLSDRPGDISSTGAETFISDVQDADARLAAADPAYARLLEDVISGETAVALMDAEWRDTELGGNTIDPGRVQSLPAVVRRRPSQLPPRETR